MTRASARVTAVGAFNGSLIDSDLLRVHVGVTVVSTWD